MNLIGSTTNVVVEPFFQMKHLLSSALRPLLLVGNEIPVSSQDTAPPDNTRVHIGESREGRRGSVSCNNCETTMSEAEGDRWLMSIDCGGDDVWEGLVPGYNGTVCVVDLTQQYSE